MYYRLHNICSHECAGTSQMLFVWLLGTGGKVPAMNGSFIFVVLIPTGFQVFSIRSQCISFLFLSLNTMLCPFPLFFWGGKYLQKWEGVGMVSMSGEYNLKLPSYSDTTPFHAHLLPLANSYLWS